MKHLETTNNCSLAVKVKKEIGWEKGAYRAIKKKNLEWGHMHLVEGKSETILKET